MEGFHKANEAYEVDSASPTSPHSGRGMPSAPGSPVGGEPGRAAGSPEGLQFGPRDTMLRVRFSDTARVIYITCVALAAAMVVLGMVSSGTMSQWWYKALEVVLTLLFTAEVAVRMATHGVRNFFVSSKQNVLEFVLCALCIGFLGAMLVAPSQAEAEAESFLGAVVISLRQALLLARLAFFVRSTHTQTGSPAAVQLHEHNNAGISLSSPANDVPRSDTISSAWDGAEDEVMVNITV
eukprot:TRINITY_DN24966_c1_g1_i2.p1 TRINITY_DN24966_c1_g1~~TRINITY_DN24966_c1_g1_i2.p1  ORF type:complete len:238 (+),score=56.05 TRINITY_DN24966_c1_g1_i2:152-865(+)